MPWLCKQDFISSSQIYQWSTYFPFAILHFCLQTLPKKTKLSIKDFFGKCDKIHSYSTKLCYSFNCNEIILKILARVLRYTYIGKTSRYFLNTNASQWFLFNRPLLNSNTMTSIKYSE